MQGTALGRPCRREGCRSSCVAVLREGGGVGRPVSTRLARAGGGCHVRCCCGCYESVCREQERARERSGGKEGRLCDFGRSVDSTIQSKASFLPQQSRPSLCAILPSMRFSWSRLGSMRSCEYCSKRPQEIEKTTTAKKCLCVCAGYKGVASSSVDPPCSAPQGPCTGAAVRDGSTRSEEVSTSEEVRRRRLETRKEERETHSVGYM